MPLSFRDFSTAGICDELIAKKGVPRPVAKALCIYLESLSDAEVTECLAAVDVAIMAMGISFTVYNDGANIDRAWPLDPIPRIIPLEEWRRTEAGLKQRLRALNMFIDDLYGEAQILADGIVPREVITKSKNFRKQCIGVKPAASCGWARRRRS